MFDDVVVVEGVGNGFLTIFELFAVVLFVATAAPPAAALFHDELKTETCGGLFQINNNNKKEFLKKTNQYRKKQPPTNKPFYSTT